jgi:hypothetical protein
MIGGCIGWLQWLSQRYVESQQLNLFIDYPEET